MNSEKPSDPKPLIGDSPVWHGENEPVPVPTNSPLGQVIASRIADKPLTREELLARATHQIEHRYGIRVDSMAEADKLVRDLHAAGFLCIHMASYNSTQPDVTVGFRQCRNVKPQEQEETAILRTIVERLAAVEMPKVMEDAELHSLVCDAHAVMIKLKGAS